MNLKQKLESIILENIADESFGVGELAEQAGMSRSTLLRKLQKESELSAGQLIRKVRLEKAKELIIAGEPTISEVSYQVGFNSTSYFIKCFKEEFGTSPGEFQKQDFVTETSTREQDTVTIAETVAEADKKTNQFHLKWIWYLLLIFISVMAWWRFFAPDIKHEEKEKSVAVLPFKNDSRDSSNVYIVNGLMDAILNNLQKLKDLRVISRTTVEKYRYTNKAISEIAEELGVSYFVEGSGQKIGDRILLNVQLIDGKNDRQIWSEAYEKDLVDIFQMQRDIAKIIAKQVNVRITPEEQKRLEEIPTQDMVAYDYFLQGLNLLNNPTGEGLQASIPLFNMAIERDPEFARAYAGVAMAYYYLDIFQAEKKHIEQVHYYAEKAYLIQPKIPQSLVAKAFSYMMKQEYETAVTYLEKALEYHPNSAFVINYLANFYTNFFPNAEKYLEYSLKGIQLDPAANDSTTNSYLYLNMSNAFMQTGFFEEAIQYADRSLIYNSNNIYSMYVKAYAEFAIDKDKNRINQRLLEIYQVDTTRIDVVQELAKSYFNLNDFQNAWVYYQKLLAFRKNQNMVLFTHENIKIAWVCKQLNLPDEEAKYLKEYRQYTDKDNSIYRPLLKASYYAYINDTLNALQYFEDFSYAEDYHYWILFLPKEPYLESIRELPAFKKSMDRLEERFWVRHEKIFQRLKKENLI